MSSFRVRLQSPTRAETIDGVVSFTGKDKSGSFGILPYAYWRTTALSYGMGTVRKADGTTEYLALPGGILYFKSNELKIATRSFIRSSKAEEITEALANQIRKNEESIRGIKQSIHRLDDELLKRLTSIGTRSSL
jgi:F-type H+-transporting ATPase subunit epsilon